MFFRKKGKLRKQFDEKLVACVDELRIDYQNDKSLLENSFDPQEELKMSHKLSETKYYYLFHELKKRQIRMIR